MQATTVNTSNPLNDLLGYSQVPELVNTNVDMIDFLNFDGFDSTASESSPESNPPNHTPSPEAYNNFMPGRYDAGAAALFGGLPPQHQQKPQNLGGPVMNDVSVKQEPFDFIPGLPQPTAGQQYQQPFQQGGFNPGVAENSGFSTLPNDQQAALLQLLANVMNYEQTYGLNAAAPAANPAQSSNAINPSLVFQNSPLPTSESSQTPASLSSTSGAVNTPQQFNAGHILTVSAPSDNESSNESLVDISATDLATAVSSPAVGSSRDTRADSIMSASDNIDDRIQKLTPLQSIFSAGRGKGGKKGGGMSSVVRGDDEELDEDESWRPSPEEYKKLSSKEKRQLRNKLSARAFRTRRKDYIGTLEAHIKDRDSVIDDIRAELLTTRNENQDLRRELAALKASTMSVLHPQTANQVGQSPAMLKALETTNHLPAINTAPHPAASRRAVPLSPINTRKDISPFDTKSGFWGGTNPSLLNGGNGNNTICHPVFTPEVVLPAQPNLNPLLNSLDKKETDRKPISLQQNTDGHDIDSSSFADWAENTPFTLKSMDNYRMQMWSRLAREAAADKANLAPELRPKFFVEPEKKGSLDETTPMASAIAAVTAAATATEHITTKLSSSFWSAFTGSASKLDQDKLAAVVTGKARLAVVPDDKAPSKRGSKKVETSIEDSLASAMAGLKVATGMTATRENLRARENPLGAVASFFKPPKQSVPAKAA